MKVIVIDNKCYTVDSARLLVEALRDHVQHLLVCGTIWVHGHSASVPTTEEQPRHPFGDYGIHKAAVESYLLDQARRQGFPATMLHAGHIVSPAALTLRGYAEALAAWFGREANLRFLPWEEWRATVSEGDAERTWDHIAHNPNCSIAKGRPDSSLNAPYDALLPGIDSSLGAVVEVKFLQQIADVGFYRAFADHQRISDFGVGFAGSDQAQNVEFASESSVKGLTSSLRRPCNSKNKLFHACQSERAWADSGRLEAAPVVGEAENHFIGSHCQADLGRIRFGAAGDVRERFLQNAVNRLLYFQRQRALTAGGNFHLDAGMLLPAGGIFAQCGGQAAAFKGRGAQFVNDQFEYLLGFAVELQGSFEMFGGGCGVMLQRAKRKMKKTTRIVVMAQSPDCVILGSILVDRSMPPSIESFAIYRLSREDDLWSSWRMKGNRLYNDQGAPLDIFIHTH